MAGDWTLNPTEAVAAFDSGMLDEYQELAVFEGLIRGFPLHQMPNDGSYEQVVKAAYQAKVSVAAEKKLSYLKGLITKSINAAMRVEVAVPRNTTIQTVTKDTRPYWQKLKDPRWQRKRLEVMQRADFKCERCGCEDSTLNVHHGYYEKDAEPWEYDSETLWCFCKGCHEMTQDELRDIRMELAKVHPNQFAELMEAVRQLAGGRC